MERCARHTIGLGITGFDSIASNVVTHQASVDKTLTRLLIPGFDAIAGIEMIPLAAFERDKVDIKIESDEREAWAA